MAEAMTLGRYRPPVTDADAHEPPAPRMVQVRESEIRRLLDAFQRLQERMPEVPIRPGILAAIEDAAPRPAYPGASLCTETCAIIARRVVASVLDADHRLMRAKPRGSRKQASARQFAIHLVHIKAGRGHEETAKAFGRNRSTASHHFEQMEDLREVPEFDAFLDVLERGYELALWHAELKPRQAWHDALRALRRAVATTLLDEDPHEMATYLVGVFKGEAA